MGGLDPPIQSHFVMDGRVEPGHGGLVIWLRACRSPKLAAFVAFAGPLDLLTR